MLMSSGQLHIVPVRVIVTLDLLSCHHAFFAHAGLQEHMLHVGMRQ